MRAFSSLSYRGQVGRLRGLGQMALDAFGVAGARLSLLAHFDNTTFRVDTPGGERFVLRIHRAHGSPSHPPRSPAEVRSEMDWLTALRRDLGLSVPVPRRTPSGEPLVIVATPGVPEPRICVLFEWLDGRFLNARLTPAHLEQVGTIIARLHQHALEWTPPPGFDRWGVGIIPPESATHMLALAAEFCEPDDVRTVQGIIAAVHAAQRELDALPGTSGLIHSDLHQENYLFSRLDGRVQAIDFDECGYGPFLYDLSVPLNELWGRKNLPELRAALLRGYQQLRPLPPDYYRYLSIFDALRILLLTNWHIEERNHPRFTNWQKEVRGNLDWLAGWLRESTETHVRDDASIL